MMPAKLATLGLLKLKLFWTEGYDVKIYVYDVTNKFLSRDLNLIVDLVKRSKFHLTSILEGLEQKNR